MINILQPKSNRIASVAVPAATNPHVDRRIRLYRSGQNQPGRTIIEVKFMHPEEGEDTASMDAVVDQIVAILGVPVAYSYILWMKEQSRQPESQDAVWI